VTDALEETVSEEVVKSTEEETQPFKIENIDDLQSILTLAQGGNPHAEQTLNKFLNFESPIERTNLPTLRHVQVMAYLDVCGKHFFPNRFDNPFTLAAHSIASAFMARNGDKSKQFVDLMRQVPSMTELQQQNEPESKGILSRFGLNRGGSGE